MNWQDHIHRVPGVCLGKPIFKDSRLTVEFVLERLAQGADFEELIREYPPLTLEKIHAALAFAAALANRVRTDEAMVSA